MLDGTFTVPLAADLSAVAVGSLQLALDRGHRNDWFESPETIIEAADYPMACYKFGRETVALVMPLWRAPKDLRIDLSRPERVEE